MSSLLVALISLILLGMLAPPVTSESLSSWLLTANYPYPGQYNMSCIDSSGYIYCIGGANGPSNQAYYATVSSSGIGAWSATANYPVSLGSPSCVASSGNLYCVGGETSSYYGTASSAVNFATLSSSGVGTWSASTSYPYANFGQSCFVSSGDIYCVGGSGASSGKDVYYASASSAGVGTWTKTGSYPVAVTGASCVTDSFGSFLITAYVYCIGGAGNSTYYAQVGSGLGFFYSPGISAWAQTASYPAGVSGASCFVSNHYVYCVAGRTGLSYTAVYFAPLTSSGIGAWSATASYPAAVQTTECVADSGYAYCVDGYLTSNSYYAQIYNIPPPSVTTTVTTTSVSTTTLTTTQTSTFTSTVTQTATTVTSTATQTATVTSTAISTLTLTQNSVSTTTVTVTGPQSTASTLSTTTLASTSSATTALGASPAGSSDLYSLAIPIGAGIAIAGIALGVALRKRR